MSRDPPQLALTKPAFSELIVRLFLSKQFNSHARTIFAIFDVQRATANWHPTC